MLIMRGLLLEISGRESAVNKSDENRNKRECCTAVCLMSHGGVLPLYKKV